MSTIPLPPKPPIDVIPKPPKKKSDTWSNLVSYLKTFGLGHEKEYIIENLSILLSAGSDVMTALRSIRTEIKSKSLQKILVNVESNVGAGMRLSQALEESRIVPKHITTLIAIGEASGKLKENLSVVVVQQAKDRAFFSKIKSALLYPAIVFGVMAVVGTGVAWFILPRVATIFGQLKIDLPWLTEVIIKIGSILQSYGAYIVPTLAIIVGLIIFFLFIYPRTKHFGQVILFQVPGIRSLLQELELAHVGFILGTLLNSGVPLVSSLETLQDTVGFYQYQKLYKHLHDNIEKGDTFAASFASFPRANRLIPTPIQQIIIAGEQSGNLEESFKKIGTVFEQKTEITTKNISVILEPILLVIVWVAVVLVALAVILPIYSLIGGLNV